MGLGNDIWQSHSRCWQEIFIQQNILWLGYAAWQGYLQHDRGVLLCEVTDAIPPLIDWQVKRVNFTYDFIPGIAVMTMVEESELETAAFAFLAEAVGTYTPEREIVMMLRGMGDVNVYRLQPKVAVPKCYAQVRQRWAEFQLDGVPPGRFYA